MRRFPNNRQPHTQLLTCLLTVKGPVDGVVVVVVPVDGTHTVVVVVVAVAVVVVVVAAGVTVEDGRRIETH